MPSKFSIRSAIAGLPALVCLLVGSVAHANNGGRLPLKRVRLYETGMGYFERAGRLSATGEMTLPVPAAHLDDALKSLVILSKGGQAKVTGLAMRSSVSADMARSLAGLAADGSTELKHAALLESLEGARVELRRRRGKPARLLGRLIDVASRSERHCASSLGKGAKAAEICTQRTQVMLSLVTARGALHHVDADDVSSVRPTDKAFKARLDAALDTLSTRGAQLARQLRILASRGTDLRLGYVSETPVWRSTYRLLLDDKGGKATVQAWALIHNDTDEDWSQVAVELVNGRPDSFLFPFVAPRYGRRHLVEPQRELSTVPQLLSETVDGMWRGSQGLGAIGIGGGGAGSGYGSARGRMGSIRRGGRVRAGATAISSGKIALGDLAALGKATGVEAGALFRYQLSERTDLAAHSSALLPFAQLRVPVTRVTFFDGFDAPARSGLHLRHTGKQTLPRGTVALFSAGGFAGETILSRLKPGESRVLRYGSDLDVEINHEHNTYTDTPKLLESHGEQLREHYVRRHLHEFELENRSSLPRQVYVALPYTHNAKVSRADAVIFDRESQRAMAVFKLAARARVTRRLEVSEGLMRFHAAADLNLRELQRLAAGLPKHSKGQGALRRAIRHRQRERRAQLRAKATKERLLRLDEELVQLRMSVSALGGRLLASSQPLVAMLLDAQTRRRALLVAEQRQRAKVKKEGQAVRRAIASL